MTTLQDIASMGLRRAGVLGKGKVLSGQLGTDALEAFRTMFDDLPGLRKGAWTGILIASSAAYIATDGERINTLSFTPTITLPTTYVDECGVTQAQRDMARVQIIGGDDEGLWVYSASTGTWSLIDGLTLASESPFGPEDDAGLAALLAVEMAPDFGEQATLSQVVVERAARQLRTFRARFRRATNVPLDNAYLFMSRTGLRGLAERTS